MRMVRLAATALAGLSLSPLAARAADFVVVEARGIALSVGATIDAAQPLTLKEGQHVTLITESGTTLKLDGPYDKVPATAADEGSGTSVLQALVTQQGARTGEVGVIRGAAPEQLPEPWVLNASRAGNVCLRDGQPVILWRPSDTRSAALVIMPADRSWKAHATWPPGTTRLVVPANVPLHQGATYLVSLDSEEVALSVKPVPGALANEAMLAAWLADQGCEGQAEALLRTAQ